MSDRDFGVLIRQSRERLGLTPSRVAELIGRAAGTIRAWEKGTSTPADPGVVSTLAAVLGIDEVSLFEAAGLEPPVTDSGPTVREALSSITPAARSAAAEDETSLTGSPEPDRKDKPEPDSASEPEAAPFVERRRQHGGRTAPVPTPDVFAPPATVPTIPTPPPVSIPGAVAVPGSGDGEGAREPRHRATSGTPGLLERLRNATARRQAPAVPLTTLPPAPRSPSYMEDPTERWSYRLRSIYTAVGVVALFIALGWAASNLLDALGSVWEELTSNL